MKKIADSVTLGKDVVLNDFVNLYGCTIGDETKIGTFVEIQKNAFIGANCKISSHTFICEGVTIEDEVFVGHGVMFINDNSAGPSPTAGCRPRTTGKSSRPWSKRAPPSAPTPPSCAASPSGSAIVGAGSVVTKDVPDKPSSPATRPECCDRYNNCHHRERRERKEKYSV